MFELVVRGTGGFERSLKYNIHDSSLVWSDTGEPVKLDSVQKEYKQNDFSDKPSFHPLTPDNPNGKIRKIKKLKIQMGLKCNYSCEYCNQASQPNTDYNNIEAVQRFIANLDTWLEGEPSKIEFWGGEPFVYWKTLKVLAPAVRAKFPNAQLLMITNGSLLNEEKIKFIEDYDICVAISHDGPGQHVRGPDPLENPEQLKYIKDLYVRRAAVNRISFNCVLTKDNLIISDIRQHIAKALELPELMVNLTTEELFTPYDETVLHLGPVTEQDHYDTRHRLFWEAVNHGSLPTVKNKLSSFFSAIANGVRSAQIEQKCGMDSPENIAVDLSGNVLTCQNTSANDPRHKIGHVSDYDNIKLTSSMHWSKRDECSKCPVLHMCRGSCMFTMDKLWEAGCDSSFTYNVAMLASAIYFLTSYVLVEIKGDDIRGRGETSIKVMDVEEIESGRIWDRFRAKKPKQVIPIFAK